MSGAAAAKATAGGAVPIAARWFGGGGAGAGAGGRDGGDLRHGFGERIDADGGGGGEHGGGGPGDHRGAPGGDGGGAEDDGGDEACVVTTAESPPVIVSVNAAWTRLCGYSADECVTCFFFNAPTQWVTPWFQRAAGEKMCHLPPGASGARCA